MSTEATVAPWSSGADPRVRVTADARRVVDVVGERRRGTSRATARLGRTTPCVRRSSRNGLSGITQRATSLPSKAGERKWFVCSSTPSSGKVRNRRVEVARRALDVDRDAVHVCDEVVRRGRAEPLLEHRVARRRSSRRRGSPRSSRWYGTPGSPRSASLTSAFVTRPIPLEFIPVFASRPASTTVTKSGPSSCVHLEHDARVEGVEQPVPVLPDQRVPVGAAFGRAQRTRGTPAGRGEARLGRLRGPSPRT